MNEIDTAAIRARLGRTAVVHQNASHWRGLAQDLCDALDAARDEVASVTAYVDDAYRSCNESRSRALRAERQVADVRALCDDIESAGSTGWLDVALLRAALDGAAPPAAHPLAGPRASSTTRREDIWPPAVPTHEFVVDPWRPIHGLCAVRVLDPTFRVCGLPESDPIHGGRE